MNFEPFLEPFTFLINFDRINNKSKDDLILEICGWQPTYDPKIECEDKFKFRNACNVNLTSAGIETMLEIYQLLTDKLVDSEPYRIKNYTGYPVQIKS